MDGKMQAKYRIGKEKPALIIHAGDIVKNGVKEEQWIKFFNISTWIHNATFYPAIGNHDLPYASFKKYFSLPNNEQWYSFMDARLSPFWIQILFLCLNYYGW